LLASWCAQGQGFVRTYSLLAQSFRTPTPIGRSSRSSSITSFPKLPAPVEEDLSRGILETIDVDSYRVEKQSAMKTALADADAEIEPAPTSGGGFKREPELDLLSNIVEAFKRPMGQHWVDG
jgi:type I restriction enzyme R subunit